MAGRPPLESALRVRVAAYFGIPASWSAKKRLAAITGATRPAKKPDLDNVVKMLDALNEVVWRDDAQVVDCLDLEEEGVLHVIHGLAPEIGQSSQPRK